MVEMEAFDEVMAIFEAQGRPLLEGPPGTGKSAFSRFMADQLGLLHISLNLSQNEGIDVHGARVVAREPMKLAGRDVTVTVQAPPDWVINSMNARENGKKGALINMEEITCITPGEFAPVLGILSEHRAADINLDRENILIMSCCNPPEMAAGGWKLSPPAINRFTKLWFSPTVHEWADNFMTYWDNPPRVKCLGKDLPESEWAQDRAMVASFAKQFPDLVNKMPAPDSGEEQFCSFRSLDLASRYKTTCRLRGILEDRRQRIWNGIMGPAAADMMVKHFDVFDLPSAPDLVDHPENFDSQNVPSDKLYYLLMACVAETLHRKRTGDEKKDKKTHNWVLDSWYNMWAILENVLRNKGPRDLVANAGRRLVDPQTYPKGAEPPAVVEEVIKVVRSAKVDWRKR